ncbi:MAG: hypothetical protein P8Y63_02075 [Deltaproteobacteria bacterium]|jgi:hypothetical protein
MKDSLIWILAGMFLLITAAPWGAKAAETAQGKSYLCALTHLVECTPLGDCRQISTDDAGLPDFIRIDLKNGMLRSASRGDKRQTPIQATEVMDGKTILTGIQNGRGWNAVLSEDKTDLIGTISDVKAGFVIFGACREE